jgi:hypothetical protein
MASSNRSRSTAGSNIRKATAASARKRRGKIQVKQRAKTAAKKAVRRVATASASGAARRAGRKLATALTPRKAKRARKGPLARLAAKTRQVLGIKKTPARKRQARAVQNAKTTATPLDLPPSMPVM